MLKIHAALAVLTLFAGLGVAHAQTTPQERDAHHPEAAPSAAPTMPGPGMSDDMQQMMRAMMGRMMSEYGMPGMGPMGSRAGMFGLRHIEGQIAFYKAELHITDSQATQWNAFADALRAGAIRLQAASRAMVQGDGLPAIPDQLKKRRELLTAELDSLQTIEPAAHALYDVLSPDQKKTPTR